jgi:4-deoxy-L-threo-5-hexosulose-uronate ketol-isomerase
MEMRYPPHQDHYKRMTTEELRSNFHIGNLFEPGKLQLVYSHVDRVIVGGAMPTSGPVEFTADKHDLGTDYFLERREVGIINIGGEGSVTADGQVYAMAKRDSLYVGQGVRQVTFNSADPNNPAQFFTFSAPAHAAYPTTHLKIEDAAPVHLGDPLNSNKRTIYKYIHPEGVKSCQIVMGMTILEPGNMWNTMPVHAHARRMETYLYFDIGADNVVFHLMGEPHETRHIVMRDREAVISPSWSIHSGMGTGSYTFLWAMAGENQTFTDMDAVSMATLM